MFKKIYPIRKKKEYRNSGLTDLIKLTYIYGVNYVFSTFLNLPLNIGFFMQKSRVVEAVSHLINFISPYKVNLRNKGDKTKVSGLIQVMLYPLTTLAFDV